MSRYYVHTSASLPPLHPAHTFVFTPSSSSKVTVEQAVHEFLVDYCRQLGVVVDASPLITNAEGRQQSLTDFLDDILDDRGDLFVTIQPKRAVKKVLLRPMTRVAAVEKADPHHLVDAAHKCLSQGQLKMALTNFTEILQCDASRECLQQTHEQVGKIHLANHRYSIARTHFEKAIQLCNETHQPKLMILLGRCCLALGEWEEADLALSRAKELLDKKGKKVHLVDLLISQALYSTGNEKKQKEAFKMVEALMKYDNHDVPTLVGYAQMAIQSGTVLPTLPYLLRAVVEIHQQKTKEVDKETRQLAHTLLTRVVRSDGGLNCLWEAVQGETNLLWFVGQILKENCGVKEAIECFRRAIENKDGKKISLVMNYVHTLMVAMDYNTAWRVIKGWMESNLDKKIGRVLIVREIYSRIKHVNVVEKDNCWCTHDPLAPEWVDLKGRLADEPEVVGAVKDRGSCDYDGESLEILSMMFTVVKIFFLSGRLQPLPSLVLVLEPLRENKSLHSTLIVNENAYMTTIAQILKRVTYPVPYVPPSHHIYVCGDSHCLPSAWSVVNLHLLRPLLSTGTKIHHLRPSCTFYPHANYEFAQQRLPAGSTVILSFGEIDCREGLTKAVARAKYDSLEEAIENLLDVYEAEWDKWARGGRSVWIHPAPPVLNPTRITVQKFQRALQVRLKSSSSVKLLEIFDDLLLAGKFNGEYAMDGTHLHPRYVKLIERELAKNSLIS